MDDIGFLGKAEPDCGQRPRADQDAGGLLNTAGHLMACPDSQCMRLVFSSTLAFRVAPTLEQAEHQEHVKVALQQCWTVHP